MSLNDVFYFLYYVSCLFYSHSIVETFIYYYYLIFNSLNNLSFFSLYPPKKYAQTLSSLSKMLLCLAKAFALQPPKQSYLYLHSLHFLLFSKKSLAFLLAISYKRKRRYNLSFKESQLL